MYEVFLRSKNISGSDWGIFFDKMIKLCHQGESFELQLRFDTPSLSVYLKTSRTLINNCLNLDGFTLNPCDDVDDCRPDFVSFLPLILSPKDNIIDISEKLTQTGKELRLAIFEIRKIGQGYHIKTYLVANYGERLQMFSAIGGGTHLLDLDLRSHYILKSPPSHLDLSRTLCLAETDKISPVMTLNTYPYLAGDHFLNLKSYDFHKHTVVFGASGSGKTKYLSNFISEVISSLGEQYHILAIDPHDALRDEIGGINGVKIYDYYDSNHGIDLFLPSEQNILSSVDMSLSLLQSLIGDGWNDHLARLLRSCIYLLTEKCELSFQSLRNLLTDVAYKNSCLKSVGEYLPESLQVFFGQEFNELKTQYYNVTLARAIALIDELQLTPAFYRKNAKRLDYELSENKATIISLNSAKVGRASTKTIAGLIMNQLFALGIGRKLHQNIILIVDEVAVVENPVLSRFLSEARKYNITVILAGQYFAQVSNDLRLAIHANVANYFCFRLNYTDAELMSRYLDIRLHSESQPDFLIARKETFSATAEEQIKSLVSLGDRKIIARVSRRGIILPAISGESIDYVARPDTTRSTPQKIDTTMSNLKYNLAAKIDKYKRNPSKISAFDLMREQSTSRRKVI